MAFHCTTSTSAGTAPQAYTQALQAQAQALQAQAQAQAPQAQAQAQGCAHLASTGTHISGIAFFARLIAIAWDKSEDGLEGPLPTAIS